ncbi:bifunctional riboflavin kinase/FAD synthetase [Flavihumibacter stibioxidans]|uniref:Riboflavin biosynthesis protein n=1 Tax=Flavihumibacter stibioxidans TaxID=1834163 RepID=A0ABR7M3Y4_9BACT|nr:bifunctional riboflavin kinase/FAD synthetase [Flavihumibacter stibioxidans]MBC6489735.1 riboflavin biosynthesis protein RibF [Flavihumibacter stibioxidans]
MQVHRNINELPAFRNAIITIGTFDGVHLGHRTIIKQLKALAEQVNGETVIITFHPHPRRIVGREAMPVQLLTSLTEKINLLQAAGIDHLVVVPFTQDFAAQNPNSYVEDFLIKHFHPHTIIIGYDHRFGRNRGGDFHLLEEYAAKGLFGLVEIPGKLLEEATISSTRIRQALLQGDLGLASNLLGYDYFFEGIVIKGNQLGRTIGYPTANLHLTDNEKLIPANGVYAVTVVRRNAGPDDHVQLKGMMNIGVRPTVDGLNRVIEVNLFDFSEDIYGETLQVTLRHRLRSEQKFDGLDALRIQLAKDRQDSLHHLDDHLLH